MTHINTNISLKRGIQRTEYSLLNNTGTTFINGTSYLNSAISKVNQQETHLTGIYADEMVL
jgi:hypothetical protein